MAVVDDLRSHVLDDAIELGIFPNSPGCAGATAFKYFGLTCQLR
jgi:hypothetical protein